VRQLNARCVTRRAQGGAQRCKSLEAFDRIAAARCRADRAATPRGGDGGPGGGGGGDGGGAGGGGASSGGSNGEVVDEVSPRTECVNRTWRLCCVT